MFTPEITTMGVSREVPGFLEKKGGKQNFQSIIFYSPRILNHGNILFIQKLYFSIMEQMQSDC